MDNQKDTKKTDINTYGQDNFVSSRALVSKPIYEFANKKTQKLVTALYMVTDCMETEDALKEKLRLLGVDLLSNIYKLPTLLPANRSTQISESLAIVYEIISFIEIAETIGYISEMNTNILKREFKILVDELKSHQSKDKQFPFILDDGMFDVERPNLIEENNSSRLNSSNLNDESKRTNSVSFTNKKTQNNVLKNVSNNSNKLTSKTHSHEDFKKIKSDRANKIISIIKDKKEASIKDISSSFSDCSEKTIQRELVDLVVQGKIKKTGAKRWSRYSLVG